MMKQCSASISRETNTENEVLIEPIIQSPTGDIKEQHREARN